MAVEEREFRHALSHFVSGVTIVSTSDDNVLYGMTVASFASLSLRPPLILVCLELSTQTHDAIRRTNHFGVSVLARDQDLLSSRFASKIQDRFEQVSYTLGSLGDPLIDRAVVALQCKVTDILPGGDHSIFVGEVVETRISDREPLVYFRSGYREIGSL